MRTLICTALSLVLVTGCTQEPLKPNEEETGVIKKFPPRTLCVVDDYRGDVVAQKCAVGQKVAYLPTRWGNEQLPVMFAAVNCDLTKSVVQTNGGVTCVFAPIELEKPADTSAKPQSSDSPAPGAQ